MARRVLVAAAAFAVSAALAPAASRRGARGARGGVALRERPEACPEPVWERICEAEQKSREKKFGSLAASMATFGLDSDAIEKNRLRIWEELEAKQASGAAPPPRKKAEAAADDAKPAGPFAGIRKAWDDVYKEADAMGYAQAVALNAQLENKGVLSKAPRRPGAFDVDDPDAPKKKAKRRKKSRGPKPAAKKGDGFGSS